MKPTIQTAGEAMPCTRRSFLAALPGLAAASAVPVAFTHHPAEAPEPVTTARERVEYHFDQLRAALAEVTGKEVRGKIAWDLEFCFVSSRIQESAES
ncbi:hypothetical protein [Rhizobium sp. NXC24]|uniref:hypothetical protein n=1 Tax=Rhizobium sp. NXC24 TaxID=2048897 RepID=UPI000CF260B4|nr:hypothetical protein [Rhizobium sp. NXC24]